MFKARPAATEYVHVGYMLWDGDDPNGLDHAKFVAGKEDPRHGPDEKGHMWVSSPIYRKPEGNGAGEA